MHLLLIKRDTPSGEAYEKEQLEFLSLEDYVSLVVDQLLKYPEDVIVPGITGDAT
ncbi:hypothetical protein CW304_04170 [Bacillus sp. UFRGS-B20]|nr:hypothetical protein CW304_04170 [Bacillus sp. UFRGS-B20]